MRVFRRSLGSGGCQFSKPGPLDAYSVFAEETLKIHRASRRSREVLTGS
jgi:hypothetical protein